MPLPSFQSGELRARPRHLPVLSVRRQKHSRSPSPESSNPRTTSTRTNNVLLGIIIVLALLFFLSLPRQQTPPSIPTILKPSQLQTIQKALKAAKETSPQHQVPLIPMRIPVVDRSILDRLDPPKSKSTKVDPGWPPIVTRIPEPSSSKTPTFNSNMKYLIPTRIAEQESKARIHLSQLYILAQALNRTLVLPKVGKSRMGICHKWDFGAYYDLDSVEGLGVKIDKANLRGRDVQVVYVKNKLQRKQLESELVWEEYNGLMFASDNTVQTDLPKCLASKVDTMGLRTRTPVLIYPKDKKDTAQPIGDALINLLRGHDAADVLFLSHDLRYPIFPPSTPGPTIKYSPLLVQLAEQLAGEDYIMVHWRMESVPPLNLPGCADALVDLLDGLLHESNSRRKVWFASDYPYTSRDLHDCQVQALELEGGPGQLHQRKSTTFRSLVPEHDQAIQILKDAFCPGGALEGWNLTDLTTEISRMDEAIGLSEDMLRDPGVLGILDKLVGMKADVFVSGKKGCARKR
ncbi:hypothetical protein VNI00_015325 [Paramarasmius palmivorus]|uniref:Uncharacterized protein n=1 Tax=Paramarasmius palmivorus TaxID=297713 RepID=A0AAW0BPI5_9AGAR